MPMGLVDMLAGELLPGSSTHCVDSITKGADAEGPYGTMIPFFNTAEARRFCVPGGGVLASAAELALFYQPLVNGGRVGGPCPASGDSGRPPLISPETLARATSVHTDSRHLEVLAPGPPRPTVLPVLRGWMVERAGDDTVLLPEGLRPSDGVHGAHQVL
eukprot:SAG22_NODE_2882_length_2126_cov_2.271337_2_plen_160_part_00